MGVVHHLQIAPKENTIVRLEDIQNFISRLVNGGHIEKEFTIWSGEENVIHEIDHYCFKDWTLSSASLELSGLEHITGSGISSLPETRNYAFKIHLSKTSEIFGKLDVFTETDFQHFPIFILFFSNPVEYTIERDYWGEIQHVGEHILIKNINCVIKGSGRNLKSTYGLDKEQDYVRFYDCVRELFGEFEIGVYY